MFITRVLTIVLFGIALLAGQAWADTSSFQGTVKGPDGKGIKGAEVSLQGKRDKKIAGMVKTDPQGHYVFKNLAVGDYVMSASANGMATAKVEGIKSKASGPVAVDFVLQKGSAAAAPAKVKRRVWVQETGSHMGRWEEVDDNGYVDQKSRRTQPMGRDGVENLQSRGTGLPGN